MRHALLPRLGETGPSQRPLRRREGANPVAQGKPAPLSSGFAGSPDGRTMDHSHTMTGDINPWGDPPATCEMARVRVGFAVR
jgi:hypothetical protein